MHRYVLGAPNCRIHVLIVLIEAFVSPRNSEIWDRASNIDVDKRNHQITYVFLQPNLQLKLFTTFTWVSYSIQWVVLANEAQYTLYQQRIDDLVQVARLNNWNDAAVTTYEANTKG